MTKSQHLMRITCVVFCLLVLSPAACALDWPVWQDSTWRPVSGTYAVFQQNISDPYLHSGIDIAVPKMTPVYAIQSGWVKDVMNLYGTDHTWRIVITDSAGTAETDGWMYAHLNEFYLAVSKGQWVDIGDSLGVTVDMTMANSVDHLHISKLRFAGDAATWASNFNNWNFIANPLDSLLVTDDHDIPVLENALGEQLLAFCQNQSSTYFSEGTPISGDVDIICRAYDYYNFYGFKTVPHDIEYCIEGDSSTPWLTAISLTDEIGSYNTMLSYVNTVYKYDDVCHSYLNADSQAYFFNLSNSNGDLDVEESDQELSWQTSYFRNGDYTVHVRVNDLGSNSAEDSMTVTVANYFDLSGTVFFSDGHPDLSGAAITCISNGVNDSTDTSGQYMVTGAAGGSQTIRIERHGYTTVDTVVMMNQSKSVNFTLVPGGYICGDVNGTDTTPDVSDLTYIVDYLFGGGPPPYVLPAGDMDGSGDFNISDLTYFVAYLFGGSPAPVCEG